MSFAPIAYGWDRGLAAFLLHAERGETLSQLIGLPARDGKRWGRWGSAALSVLVEPDNCELALAGDGQATGSRAAVMSGVLLVATFGVLNAGVRRSGMLLQQALGLTVVDGWVGPATLTACRTNGSIIGKLGVAQANFYRGLATFPTFGRGWLARVDARVAAATWTAP